MRIFLNCQRCETRLKVPESLAGKQVRCPLCEFVSWVPPTAPFAQTNPAETKNVEVGPDSGLGVKVHIDHETQVASLMGRPQSGITQEDIIGLLNRHGVKAGLDVDAIKALLDAKPEFWASNKGAWTVARGVRPQDAQGARFVMSTVNDAGLATEEDEAHESRVDFKEVKSIQTVEEGDFVADYWPPREAVAGIRLNGDSWSSETEIEDQVMGDGVIMGACGRKVFAARAGRPVLAEGTLDVLQIYEVENVDFSEGNLRFDGHVIVNGHILDEFVVECKSIEVNGTVGGSIIYCAQDAHFNGGVNGNGKCKLFVGGNCEAKYLNQVNAYIGGDLEVERSITNSEAVCLGMVKAERVVGGRLSAREGIEVKDLGSDLGVVTVLGPGLDFLPMRKAEETHENEAEDMRDENSEPEVEEHVTTSVPVGSAVSIKASLRQRFFNQQSANDDEESPGVEPVYRVNVTGKMHADVIVCGPNRCREFVEVSAGKMSVTPDPETGQFEKTTYRKLKRRPSPDGANEAS